MIRTLPKENKTHKTIGQKVDIYTVVNVFDVDVNIILTVASKLTYKANWVSVYQGCSVKLLTLKCTGNVS